MNDNIIPILTLGSLAGPALQNVATIYTLIFITFKYRPGKFLEKTRANLKEHPKLGWAFGIYAIWLLWMILIDFLHQPHQLSAAIGTAIGYSMPIIIPLIKTISTTKSPELNLTKEQPFYLYLGFLVLALGLMTMSQMLFSWRWDGLQIVSSEPRGRGFFSHPLTMAYVVGLWWAPALMFWMKNPKSLARSKIVLGLALMAYASQSRIIQPLIMASTAFLIIRNWPRRARIYSLGVLFFVITLISITENPVRNKFLKTWQGTEDRHTEIYVDDRMAFWHAHFHLWMNHPVTGVGLHADSQILEQAYQDIGLSDFPKKYGAHNLYLQILATSGIVGLLLFLAWAITMLQACLSCYTVESRLERDAILITAAVFAISSVFQNSFQDFEVRYALSVLCALGLRRV